MTLDSQFGAGRALAFETPADFAAAKVPADVLWRVEDISGGEVRRSPRWLAAFSEERKDRRYYEVCEETIDQGFDYRYFVLKDESGEICAIQPYFINDQDVLAEASSQAPEASVPGSPPVAQVHEDADFDAGVSSRTRAS